MPSRINIGPEDGPYVAINESSGNLQLEDNSGNVVAEWDETNAQWDFANNTLNNVDALNSNSVSTDNQTITQSLTDPTDTTHQNKFVGAFGTATPTAYFSGPTHGEGETAFFGATLAPDGRVIFSPRDSSNVGIFDPSDDSYTSGPTHGEGEGAFQGATLAPGGRVIFVPFDSSNVGIVSQLLDFAVSANANK